MIHTKFEINANRYDTIRSQMNDLPPFFSVIITKTKKLLIDHYFFLFKFSELCFLLLLKQKRWRD